MGCGASGENIKFINGKPDFSYDEIVKCFAKEGNGLAFRMVNKKKKQWAYYNDTDNYEMHVKVTFHDVTDLKALGKTRIEVVDGEKGGKDQVASVVVYPSETELFIEGVVGTFSAKVDALPLSDEYRAVQAEKKKK